MQASVTNPVFMCIMQLCVISYKAIACKCSDE